MNRLIAVILFLLFQIEAISQTAQPNFEIIKRLGRGINMGNSFEAPTETAWGNPWKPEYFKIMAEQGFTHVRVPVRWETPERSLEVPPYTITPAFLNRIKEVVEAARKNKLHIILNMHNHDQLLATPDDQKNRFLSQWNQIATFFKSYSDSLLFEVLNEPHGNITTDKWNVFFNDALTEIRKTNPTRWVLMGTAEYGGLTAVNKLQLPADDHIVLSIHYYNPFHFTHQGADWVGPESATWLGTQWRDTQDERTTVMNEFKEVLQFSIDHNIPLHVGEFGSYSTADLESRGKWTTYLARWLEEKKLSWAYWEFSAGFGIYNPTTGVLSKTLVDALQHNVMPAATLLPYTTLYESNFANGVDGWVLSNQGGAVSTLSKTSGGIQVSVNNGGSETWHVQLTKTGMALKKDKTYRLSFDASATANRNATYYLGKAADPWTAYSSYNGASITTSVQSFTSTFTMKNDTDLQARLVVDLGKSTESVLLNHIKLEELQEVITGIDKDELPFSLYPNPVKSELYLKNIHPADQLFIYNLNGKIMIQRQLNQPEESIDVSAYPNGLYLLRVEGRNGTKVKKFVKE
jgi:aryl-phospho-beta-D-glucosidase BglC (GH1 family)